jgi:hypothetical protein
MLLGDSYADPLDQERQLRALWKRLEEWDNKNPVVMDEDIHVGPLSVSH